MWFRSWENKEAGFTIYFCEAKLQMPKTCFRLKNADAMNKQSWITKMLYNLWVTLNTVFKLLLVVDFYIMPYDIPQESLSGIEAFLFREYCKNVELSEDK